MVLGGGGVDAAPAETLAREGRVEGLVGLAAADALDDEGQAAAERERAGARDGDPGRERTARRVRAGARDARALSGAVEAQRLGQERLVRPVVYGQRPIVDAHDDQRVLALRMLLEEDAVRVGRALLGGELEARRGDGAERDAGRPAAVRQAKAALDVLTLPRCALRGVAGVPAFEAGERGAQPRAARVLHSGEGLAELVQPTQGRVERKGDPQLGRRLSVEVVAEGTLSARLRVHGLRRSDPRHRRDEAAGLINLRRGLRHSRRDPRGPRERNLGLTPGGRAQAQGHRANQRSGHVL